MTTSLKRFCFSLHECVSLLYLSYRYVQEGGACFTSFKPFYDQYVSPTPTFDVGTEMGQALWQVSLMSSIAKLAEILRAFHRRPCILLLDEFDTPFMSAMKCPSLNDREEISTILITLLKMVLKVGHVCSLPPGSCSCLS